MELRYWVIQEAPACGYQLGRVVCFLYVFINHDTLEALLRGLANLLEVAHIDDSVVIGIFDMVGSVVIGVSEPLAPCHPE